MRMDPIFKRQLARLEYMDPEVWLRKIMPTVEGILQRPETVKHLTAREKNAFLQKHQAGFLGLLVKRNTELLDVQISLAFGEIADSDCVLRAVDPIKGTAYKLVQLKQLPSHAVNADAHLQALIDRLKGKYHDAANLIVAIWVNRDIKLRFEELDFTGLDIEQLWFFGDAVSGELTLDGGHVAHLISGARWASRLKGFDLQIRRVRFRRLVDLRA
jgi:hypothetical protein